jgi:FkbM family methyltransferase
MMRKALSQFLYRKYNYSFSQAGEDVILGGYMTQKQRGFYVDIGAFHPYMLSNTFRFYRKGWSGINIDAAPGSMEAFKKLRPRDINIEAAISETSEQLTYYYLGAGNSMNTFSKEFLTKLGAEGQIKKEINITTRRLDAILEEHAAGKEINVMSIDVEGLELSVLRSNNWDKFRPQLISLESFEVMNEQGDYDVEIRNYFKDIGYKLISKTINGIFFLREDLKLNPYNHVLF